MKNSPGVGVEDWKNGILEEWKISCYRVELSLAGSLNLSLLNRSRIRLL